MAKRFIDTDVFKKQFLRGLKASYKLFWFYITTDCNHAGIWECDFEVAQLRTGQKIDPKTALKLFKDKIIEIDGGSKWFIPSFINFQYGHLSEKNRAHINVISVLAKYNLLDENNLPKPLTSSLEGAKEKDMEQEEEKETEMEKDKEQEKEEAQKSVVNPFSDRFTVHWETWKEYKRDQLGFTYKSVITEQAAINDLVKVSKGDEVEAGKIILQSISKGWKGLFELKKELHGTGSEKFSDSKIKEALANRIRERG